MYTCTIKLKSANSRPPKIRWLDPANSDFNQGVSRNHYFISFLTNKLISRLTKMNTYPKITHGKYDRYNKLKRPRPNGIFPECLSVEKTEAEVIYNGILRSVADVGMALGSTPKLSDVLNVVWNHLVDVYDEESDDEESFDDNTTATMTVEDEDEIVSIADSEYTETPERPQNPIVIDLTSPSPPPEQMCKTQEETMPECYQRYINSHIPDIDYQWPSGCPVPLYDNMALPDQSGFDCPRPKMRRMETMRTPMKELVLSSSIPSDWGSPPFTPLTPGTAKVLFDNVPVSE